MILYEENPAFADARSLDNDLVDITENNQKIEELNFKIKQQKKQLLKAKQSEATKEAEKCEKNQSSEKSDEGAEWGTSVEISGFNRAIC